MFKLTVALALAILAFASSKTYQVRVRNLTYLQPFSPILVVAHTTDIAVFQEGFMAIDAVRIMAEDGNNSALIELGSIDEIAEYVCGSVEGGMPLFPGETMRLQMEVDDDFCDGRIVFSLVSMLINTNDAFVGIDSYDLETTKLYPPAYDAGTEENNELCTHIPGPACDVDSGNLRASPGEGPIHIHRGVHGIGDIAASNYDWRNPVAEVFVSSL